MQNTQRHGGRRSGFQTCDFLAKPAAPPAACLRDCFSLGSIHEAPLNHGGAMITEKNRLSATSAPVVSLRSALAVNAVATLRQYIH